MENSNIYQKVNEYLAKWDPIGLPQEIANVEYVGYVPEIVEVLSDKKALYISLKSFLNKLGICDEDTLIDIEKELYWRVDELTKLKKECQTHEVFFRIYDKEKLKGISSWLIAYDDKKKCTCCEVGIGNTGNVITKAPCEGFHDYWLHSIFTIKEYVELFPFEFISKEEFESVWNDEPNQITAITGVGSIDHF